MKACRSAQGVGTAGADPSAGAVLLSKLLSCFLKVWFGVARRAEPLGQHPPHAGPATFKAPKKSQPSLTTCKAASPRLAELHLPSPSQTETMCSGLAGVRVTSQIISMPLPGVLPQFQRGGKKIVKGIDGTCGNTTQPRRHQEPVVDGRSQP